MTIDEKLVAQSKETHAEAERQDATNGEAPGATPGEVDASGSSPSQLDEVPSPLEQQSLMQLTRAILNPNGDDPRIDQYITSSFSYILSAFYKMATATDKDVAAKEIADDLNTKFENWVATREQKHDENDVKKEEKEEEKEEKKEKIEEVN